MPDSKRWRIPIFVLHAIALAANGAIAAPENGVAAYLGGVAAREGSENSRGVSFGLDAQFVVDPRWSLNPTLLASYESTTTARRISDGMVGLQARRWFGRGFVGVQGFYHVRLVLVDGATASSNYGPAAGLVGGFEGASGWGGEAQLDLFENTPEKGVFRHALRVHATYRWR